MARRVRAFIGLGANLGRPQSTLAAAVDALAALPGVSLLGVSPLYRTRPVGVADQPDFLNAVVALEVPESADPETGALALLEALKQLEVALGRRPGRRWGPRLIDLDLLLFGRHMIHAERHDSRWLTVPHPQLADRLFVLQPLADLAPRLRPPGWSETVAAACRRRLTVEGPAAVTRLTDGGEWAQRPPGGPTT